MTPRQWAQWERRWQELASATDAARKQFLAVDRSLGHLGLTLCEREANSVWESSRAAWETALKVETRHYNAAMGRDQ